MKRKRIITLVVIGLLAFAVVIVTIQLVNRGTDKLSDAEIADLRDEYPINYQDSGLATTIDISLKEAISYADTFVYGRILGAIDEYTENIGSGISAIDDMHADVGGMDEFSFFGYTIEVIEDSEGLFSEGDLLYIEANTLFADTIPDLDRGMQMIIPVTDWQTETKTNRYNFARTGMYYVTEDGYTLSVFQEYATESLTGHTVQQTLDSLRK